MTEIDTSPEAVTRQYLNGAHYRGAYYTDDFIKAIAADHDRIVAENARLREALERFAEVASGIPDAWRPHDSPDLSLLPMVTVGDFRRARAALSKAE